MLYIYISHRVESREFIVEWCNSWEWKRHISIIEINGLTNAFRIASFFFCFPYPLNVSCIQSYIENIERYFQEWERDRKNISIIGIKNIKYCKILPPFSFLFFSILSSNRPVERRKRGTERCNDPTDENVPSHEVRRLLESRMA